MKDSQNNFILQWIQQNPGIFLNRQEKDFLELRELHSGKNLRFYPGDVQSCQEKSNSLHPQQTYLLLLLKSGHQLVLSQQGFAFPPDFRHTGPLPLPSQVYCMGDYQMLLSKCRHLTEHEERRRDCLDLLMLLIALLDGAAAVGLNVDTENHEVETLLIHLEKGK